MGTIIIELYEISSEQIHTIKKMLGRIQSDNKTIKRRLKTKKPIEPVCDNITKLVDHANKILDDIIE